MCVDLFYFMAESMKISVVVDLKLKLGWKSIICRTFWLTSQRGHLRLMAGSPIWSEMNMLINTVMTWASILVADASLHLSMSNLKCKKYIENR